MSANGQGSGRYVSIGVMASMLGVPAASIERLVVECRIDADADASGHILLFHESQIARAREALKHEAHHIHHEQGA